MKDPICQHCGESIKGYRRKVYCSHACKFEAKQDAKSNPQRIASFQALADAGTWRRIDNFVLQSLSHPNRRLKLVEKSQIRIDNSLITSYRLTDAGYKLLVRWKTKYTQIA